MYSIVVSCLRGCAAAVACALAVSAVPAAQAGAADRDKPAGAETKKKTGKPAAKSAQRADAKRPTQAQLAARPAASGHRLDASGRRQVGKASYYAPMFSGRKMADGTRMDPRGNNAASKTLPLGTKARVTNLETGKSAVVTIKDRGPYVKGRVVDLSPATAQKVGITREDGVADVEVVPISVPKPDGSVKPGAAAGERGAMSADADAKPGDREATSSGR